jgi:hypothetical protein
MCYERTFCDAQPILGKHKSNYAQAGFSQDVLAVLSTDLIGQSSRVFWLAAGGPDNPDSAHLLDHQGMNGLPPGQTAAH